MTREERNEVLEECREAMNNFCDLAAAELVDSIYEDDEILTMTKLLRLTKKMFDYAEFQVKQLDSIEDKLDQLNTLIVNKKEAI